VLVGACVLAFGGAVPATADGEFFQFDFAPGASTVVGSVVRGPLGAALGWSDYVGGSALSANVTYSAALPVLGDGALVRLGPTARRAQDNDIDIGAKVVFERWSPTDRGGVFLLADFNTILNEYLALGELSDQKSGISGSFAIQGGDYGFRENTLVLGYAVPDSRVRLRLGYRFEAHQVFIGFSLNTF